MARRRAQRPDWWPNPRRDLERVIVERVIAALVVEGHVIAGVWSPEHEPNDPRLAGRPSKPEAALTIDGRDAAIDVTGFLTSEMGEAAQRATAVSRTVKAALGAAGLERLTLVMLIYRPIELAALDDRAALAVDVEWIVETVVNVARGPDPVQRLRIDPASLPWWLDRLSVTTVDRQKRPDVIAFPLRDPVNVARVLEAIASSKGRQLAPWGLGIVAIRDDFVARAADVEAHLATRRDWPFWRVYWCDASGAHLVWEAAPSDG